MRIFCTALILAFLSGPAFAQEKNVPTYGDTGKPKSPQDIAAEKAADKAYQNSLGNIPDKGPVDPWGNARGTDAPKSAAKITPAKPASKSAAKTAPTKTVGSGTTAN